MTPRRQHGAVLLMVAIVLATVAALAVGVNTMASAESRSAQGAYEVRAAAYLADAGVAAIKWSSQVNGCARAVVPATALGGGSFEAWVVDPKDKPKKIDIVASGAVNGIRSRPLERKQVTLYDLSKTESSRLTKDARDLTIDSTKDDDSDDDEEWLMLTFNSAHALLFWETKDIKKETLVLSATLTLTPYTSNGTGGAVAIARLTTKWDDDATWRRPGEDKARWDGGNYVALPAATAAVAGAATTQWDVTELVNGWVSGQFTNYGMLLRLANPGPSVRFYSLDASSSRRPVLHMLSAKPC